MTAWDDEVARARDDLLEEFARAGFTLKSSVRIEGEIPAEGRLAPVPVDITIPGGFPYEPPVVRPIDGSGGLSWHANVDGSLCLWAAEESGDLPWMHVDEIVERVQAWFRNDAAGGLVTPQTSTLSATGRPQRGSSCTPISMGSWAGSRGSRCLEACGG